MIGLWFVIVVAFLLGFCARTWFDLLWDWLDRDDQWIDDAWLRDHASRWN